MRRAVDAAREARHDRDAGFGELGAQPPRRLEAGRRGRPSADDGDACGCGDVREVAEREAHRGRLGIGGELGGIVGPAQQPHCESGPLATRERGRGVGALRGACPQRPHVVAVTPARRRDAWIIGGAVPRHRLPRLGRRPPREQRSQASGSHQRQVGERDGARDVVLAVHTRSALVVRDRVDAELQRDGHVAVGDDLVTAVEVAQRAGDPPHSVEPAAREPTGFELAPKQRRGPATERREVVEPRPVDVGVRLDAASTGDLARAAATRHATVAEASPDGRSHELVDARTHDRDAQVEPIDERARHPPDVPVSHRLAARARARLPALTARAWVHRRDEQHLGRERDCCSGPADADHPLLEWLAEAVEHRAR